MTSLSTGLLPTPEIQSIFPHSFELAYVVTLSPTQLSTDLHVTNPTSNGSASDLKFQALLHSYLAVDDATTAYASGLEPGLKYVDKVKGGEVSTWQGGELRFAKEPVDRVYHAKGDADVALVDGNHKMIVHSVELPE